MLLFIPKIARIIMDSQRQHLIQHFMFLTQVIRLNCRCPIKSILSYAISPVEKMFINQL